MKVGCFDANYIETVYQCEGYFDQWNIGTQDINVNDETRKIKQSRGSLSKCPVIGQTRYNLILSLNMGIFNCIQPLAPNTEIKICFDRARAELSLINKELETTGNEELKGEFIDIISSHLEAEYVSSPFMRNFFQKIEQHPIVYKYDDCEVYVKNLRTGQTNIQLDNIIGGNTPVCLFAWIIEAEALNIGRFDLSSTCFQRHGVKQFSLTLNGVNCHGFPIDTPDKSPVQAYHKFLNATERFAMISCSRMLKMIEFTNANFLWSHKFEAERSNEGWLGINLQLDDAWTKNYVMGMFIIPFNIYFFI